jgi:putative MATE family efflux protein
MAEKNKSSNIRMVTGDPKAAINKIAVPMILTMLITTAYNLVDSIWVAGLGPGPLAALGLFTPLYLVFIGVGNGMGAGANSLIARYIGAKDYENASNAGIHSILLSIILSIIFPVILLFFLKDILVIIGASSVLGYTYDYSSVIVLCTFASICPSIFASIFRAEGDMKRATVPIVLSALINVVLDPIFIYTFNMGIAGAAWATVLSSTVSIVIMLYWMLIDKSTYLSLDLKNYRTNWSMYYDILYVGIPASLELLVMAFLSSFNNTILVSVGGTNVIAAYTGAWRLISIGNMPSMGICAAMITVAGASYGANNWNKVNESFNYSIKSSLIISVVMIVLLYVFAGQISQVFAYSVDSGNLDSLIAEAIRVLCLFLIPLPFGIAASSMLQALGKGPTSLALILIRKFIMVIIFVLLFVFIFNWGYVGVYWGIVIGNMVGSFIAYFYLRFYLNRLKGRMSLN